MHKLLPLLWVSNSFTSPKPNHGSRDALVKSKRLGVAAGPFAAPPSLRPTVLASGALLRCGARPAFAHNQIEQSPPVEFRRRLAALILPPGFHTIRYLGLFVRHLKL